jgi:hypothetical protein
LPEANVLSSPNQGRRAFKIPKDGCATSHRLENQHPLTVRNWLYEDMRSVTKSMCIYNYVYIYISKSQIGEPVLLECLKDHPVHMRCGPNDSRIGVASLGPTDR